MTSSTRKETLRKASVAKAPCTPCTHGYERSRSFMISGYYGWLGNGYNLDYSLLPLGLGLFTKIVI